MWSVSVIVFFFPFVCFVLGGPVVKPVETETRVVRATTNVSVPSADYILDAVECLRQAISVYNMGNDAVKFYAELFKQKHPVYNWNVVAGFTAIYLDMEYYVETVLTSEKSTTKNKDKPSDTDIKFIIFSPKFGKDIVSATAPETLPKVGNWTSIIPRMKPSIKLG